MPKWNLCETTPHGMAWSRTIGVSKFLQQPSDHKSHSIFAIKHEVSIRFYFKFLSHSLLKK